MEMAHLTADDKIDCYNIAKAIRQNVADSSANRISWEQFSNTNIRLWREARLGNHNILGTIANARSELVSHFLDTIIRN